MRQKIDITDVEQATKIRAKYLRALENEEFDLLHGGTFVRSFLRTYAQYLGLDAQRLLEDYRSQYEPRDPVELRPIAPRPSRGGPPRGAPPPPRRGAIGALLAVGFVAFLLVLGLTGDEEDGGGDGRPPEGAAETEGTPTARERSRERGARRERRERRSAPRGVRVRVVPTAPVYVCWDRGPDTESEELSGLAEPRTLTGRRVRINIGNPSAAVSVGGDRLELEGPGPFGFDIRPGREPRPIPSGQRPCQ